MKVSLLTTLWYLTRISGALRSPVVELQIVDAVFHQVYTLEKVLKIKKDTVSGINFLDEAMKVSHD